MKIELNHLNHEAVLQDHQPYETIWNSKTTIDGTRFNLIHAPSGRGKSTLVSFLLGLRQNYNGKILFDGNDIGDFSLNDWINIRKNKVAAVFQTLDLFPKLTTLENILVKNDLTKQFSLDEILKMLSRLGVLEQKDQIAATLSMGQKQRVSIIRALCQPFDCIILDEPFSHLDEKNTQLALELIIEHCDQQKAGLILTTLGETYKLKEFNMYKL